MSAVSERAATAGAVSDVRHRPASLDVPWPYATVLVAAGFLIVSVALLLTAWGGASRQADPRDQVLWLNVGVLAVSVLGAGCALWLLVGRRSVAARSRLAQQALASALGLDRRDGEQVAHEGLVTSTGLTRRHRTDCPLMAGRLAVPAADACEPCGVCGS